MKNKFILILLLSSNLIAFSQKNSNAVLFNNDLPNELFKHKITVDNLNIKYKIKNVQEITDNVFDKDQELSITNTFFIENKRIMKHVFIFDEFLKDEKTYTYNAKNQLTKIDINSINDNSKVFFEYEKKKLKKVKKVFESMDDLIIIYQYQKDSITIYDGEDLSKIKIKNNKFINYTKITDYGITYKHILDYNSKNQIIKHQKNIITSDILTKIENTTFKYNNNLIKSFKYVGTDKENTGKKPEIISFEYEYLYDEFNNWIAIFQTLKQNSKYYLYKTHVRSIKYKSKITGFKNLEDPLISNKIKELKLKNK